MRGDVHVRFGGRYGETCRSNAARRSVPSLHKGGQQEQPIVQQDVLKNLQEVITPLVSRPRSKEPAQAYKELIASPVYFSNEKWSECLTSHGLIVDMERRTLTVQSESVNADMVYDLTEEEVKKLATASIEEQPVEKRLDLLNGIIGADFADGKATRL